MNEILQAILEHGTAKGAKSTILKPLGWMMATCITAAVSTARFVPDSWLVYLFSIFAAITMFLYVGAYVFCLFVDRDALRSETYSIQKLAITNGFIGDDIVGVIDNSKEKLKQVDQSTPAIDINAEVNK